MTGFRLGRGAGGRPKQAREAASLVGVSIRAARTL